MNEHTNKQIKAVPVVENNSDRSPQLILVLWQTAGELDVRHKSHNG